MNICDPSVIAISRAQQFIRTSWIKTMTLWSDDKNEIVKRTLYVVLTQKKNSEILSDDLNFEFGMQRVKTIKLLSY